ncbi:hypothetical protein D3C72_2285190 [compost metagenome]
MPGPDLGHQRLGTGLVMAIVDTEPVALPRQMTGGRRPYPPTTPGDQCNPVHPVSLSVFFALPRY